MTLSLKDLTDLNLRKTKIRELKGLIANHDCTIHLGSCTCPDWQQEKEKLENMYNFENYLQDLHAQDYHGTDDDMPDAYERWLSEFDANDILELVAKYEASK